MPHDPEKPVPVRVTARLLELFDHFRLETGLYQATRLQVGDCILVAPEAQIEPYAHILEGFEIPSRYGAFSYSRSPIKPSWRVGRYCSIASRVSQFSSAHPTDWISSSPFSHNPSPLGGFRRYLNDIGVEKFALRPFDLVGGAIHIGHDVWIGDDALIKPGIRIETGAIIAARAIVTRDVPPFAIVGGSPAKIIRYRFDEEIIEAIQGTQWWRYGPEILQPLDVRNPSAFVDRFRESVVAGAKPLAFQPLTAELIIEAGEVDAA